MADHEVFDQQKEVNSFHSHKSRLSIENPEWTEAMVYKQALIDFNTMMYPNQVKSYLREKRGDRVGHVEQAYKIVDNDLFDPYYGFFQAMINYETTEIGRASLENFRQEAISALPGQTIFVLDMSGLGIGKGIKYLDTYVKDEGGLIKHKERIDLTGDQPDLTIEQAQEFLIQPEETSAMLPVEQFQSLPEIQLTEPTPILIEQTVEPEKLIPLVTTGFWFGMATAVVASPSVIETPAPVFEMPTGFHPEGTIELAESKPIVKEVPTRTDFVGQPSGMILEAPAVQEPTRRVLVGQKIVEPVSQKTEKRVERGIEIQTTQPRPKLSAEQTVVFKVTPTRIIPVGPEQIETVIEKSSTLLYSDRHIKASDMKKVPSGRVPEGKPGKNQREVVYHSALPPIYKIPQIQFKPDVLNENEIPLWQMSVDPDKDLNIFMLTMFFLLVNTKWLRLDEGFPIVRGRGFGNF